MDAENGDLRLRSDSPAVDAGDNAAVQGVQVDLGNNPRIVGSAVDMGGLRISRAVINLGKFTGQ
jgi:hypothetical protein